MNKLIALTILSSVIAACNSANTNTDKAETLSSSEVKEVNSVNMENQETDYDDGKIWIGEINQSSLQNGNYDWYDVEKGYHTVNEIIVNEIKSDLQEFDIEIFMGTWCADSQRETPAFFKIMEAAEYPVNRIKMYALDDTKQSPLNTEEVRNVEYVPTFIFFKNGEEVGRIVESPINTLEEDIRDIVKGTPQTPNYSE